MDLVQVVYVALAYLSFALVALVSARGHLIGRRSSRLISTVAFTLAAATLGGAMTAAWFGPVETIGAGTAFVLSIPFMTTFAPYLLGAALLGQAAPFRVVERGP